MPVTLKDVAARAGVSPSAVSRTFTDGASVSAKMREKVEQAAADLGYSPNALASSLTTGRTKMIGLVSNNFHNPLFLEVFDLFTLKLQDRGLRPLLMNLTGETDAPTAVRRLQQYSVDGVIVASSTLPPAFSAAFRAAGLPVVNSFGRFSTNPQVHVVGVDNSECGRMAARTLVDRGYTSVGFLGGPEQATSTQDRFRGFRQELAKHPHIASHQSFAADYSFDAGRAEMQRLIASGTLAQAYFCGDDVLSIGALTALSEAGMKAPCDIGIIGFNNMEMARWPCFDLTTIAQPTEAIITASVDQVIGLSDAPERAPDVRLFPCTLIERGTLRRPDP